MTSNVTDSSGIPSSRSSVLSRSNMRRELARVVSWASSLGATYAGIRSRISSTVTG